MTTVAPVSQAEHSTLERNFLQSALTGGLEFVRDTLIACQATVIGRRAPPPLAICCIRFESKEDATAYCERHGIAYLVSEPHSKAAKKIAYADNFAFRRMGQWTH